MDIYYLLIIIAVVMFGGCFKLNDVYRKRMGSGLKISLAFILVSSLCTLPVVMAISGFRFSLTPFTAVMALLVAANGIAFTFCSFRALGKINLSLYSLFSMLGGMALPFVQGLIFYGEKLTVAKIVCFVLITAALLLTVRRGTGKGGWIYYIGIFTLNGMSGVLSKIYVSSPFERVDVKIYSVWSTVASIILVAVVYFVLALRESAEYSSSEEVSDPNPPVRGGILSSLIKGWSLFVVAVAATGGIVNRIANLLLVISLEHVDGSLQYPLVTGGVMIVSTVICFFDKQNKPSLREMISVSVAFVGTLALFLIPV